MSAPGLYPWVPQGYPSDSPRDAAPQVHPGSGWHPLGPGGAPPQVWGELPAPPGSRGASPGPRAQEVPPGSEGIPKDSCALGAPGGGYARVSLLRTSLTALDHTELCYSCCFAFLSIKVYTIAMSSLSTYIAYYREYDFTLGQNFIMIGLYTPNMVPSRSCTVLQ